MRTRKRRTSGKKKACAPDAISPQTLLACIGRHDVAVVNTLDESIVICSVPPRPKCCFGKDFIDKSCRDLSKYKVVVLYCANDTCNASHTYGKRLLAKCPGLKHKIGYYRGGSFEWGLLALNDPTSYGMYNLSSNSALTTREIQSYVDRMQHRAEADASTKPLSLCRDQRASVKSSSDRCDGENGGRGLMADKVCVVTGGTSGLGLSTVKEMLAEGAKHVTLTYWHNKARAKRVDEELSKRFPRTRFYVLRADARTPAGNHLTFDREERRKRLKLDVGPIDAVDINAGIFGPANMHKKHIFNISDKDYHETMATNLTGYFLGLKAFSQQAIRNKVKGASAVCIKSIYGSTGSLFSNIAYQTSKHGVMGLVQQAAIELARSNKGLKIPFPIRVNAVSPTFTTTALTRPFLDKPIIKETIENDNPTGKLALKEDVANAVIYLLSDKAASVTGVDLPVDCGVLAESVPTYSQVEKLNDAGIDELSCCGADI